MQRPRPSAAPDRSRRPLRVVRAEPGAAGSGEDATASRFAETVRTVLTLARRRGLRPPVFRSPPGIEGIDRSIRRRPSGSVVVAVRRSGRPLAAVQADVIEGVVAANFLVGEPADRFRHAAWAALDGRGGASGPRATMEPEPPARVA